MLIPNQMRLLHLFIYNVKYVDFPLLFYPVHLEI